MTIEHELPVSQRPLEAGILLGQLARETIISKIDDGSATFDENFALACMWRQYELDCRKKLDK